MMYVFVTPDLLYVVNGNDAEDAREHLVRILERDYAGPIRDERINAVRAASPRMAVDGVRLIRTFPIGDMDYL